MIDDIGSMRNYVVVLLLGIALVTPLKFVRSNGGGELPVSGIRASFGERAWRPLGIRKYETTSAHNLNKYRLYRYVATL